MALFFRGVAFTSKPFTPLRAFAKASGRSSGGGGKAESSPRKRAAETGLSKPKQAAAKPSAGESPPKVSKARSKAHGELEKIETRIRGSLERVSARPEPPPPSAEDEALPDTMKRKLASTARSTAKSIVQDELRKISKSAQRALELPEPVLPGRRRAKAAAPDAATQAALAALAESAARDTSALRTETSKPEPALAAAAAPRAEKRPRKGPSQFDPEQAAEVLRSLRAEDVVVLDLRGKCMWTSFFVLASASTNAQLRALAQAFVRKMSEKNNVRMSAPPPDEDWISIDLSNVVVHLMLPKTRRYYNLEKLWTDMPPLEQQLLQDTDALQDADPGPPDLDEAPELRSEFQFVESAAPPAARQAAKGRHSGRRERRFLSKAETEEAAQRGELSPPRGTPHPRSHRPPEALRR